MPHIAEELEELPEDPSGEGGILPADAEHVRGPRPKGTVEEAQSREHMMTRLPKNQFCEVCSKAKIQRKQKRKAANKAVPDGPLRKPPVQFGEQVTGDHFIKNASSVIEEDANFLY